MVKKILLGLLALVLIVVLALFIYVQTGWDRTYDVAYPELQSSTDSAVVAQGAYLVNGPAHCGGCHVANIEDMIRASKGEETSLKGGVRFTMGPLGAVYPKNLTPDAETGIGRYSDGEIFRMMRHVVKPNGQSTITPMMPFWNMADDDMIAVVSYLRSLEPVRHEVPEPDWTFMGKAIKAVSPTFKPILNPNPPAKAPPMEATIERGEYLARYVANCVGCHTPRDPMTFEAIGPDFSGGMEMEPFPELHVALNVSPDLWTRSPNLTPYANSVMSKFPTLESWKTRFHQGRIIPHSPMDWSAFGRMTDEDMAAIYLFLRSLDPVENDIEEVVFKKG